MSRQSRSRSSKRRIIATQEEDEADDEETPVPMSRRRIAPPSQDQDDDDHDEQEVVSSQGFAFSQQVPESSQTVLPERANERRNLEVMDRDAREKALLSLSRLILFKALDHEPIDRLKSIKDAGIAGDKISSAAYQEVASRFKNVFGFELKQTPAFMQKYKSLPPKFKERYYVVNTVEDSDDGSHSRSIHSIHKTSKIEKGVLILTVALIFCKGECRADGSRHILARDLYRLMHAVDDNIPEDPPAQGTARAKVGMQRYSRLQGMSSTPNLDVMLENFVHWDYLIKEKATDDNFLSAPVDEGDFLYSMGPRAALELGRRQIITFCAEILGEEPDPSMINEIQDDNTEGDDEAFMDSAEVN